MRDYAYVQYVQRDQSSAAECEWKKVDRGGTGWERDRGDCGHLHQCAEAMPAVASKAGERMHGRGHGVALRVEDREGLGIALVNVLVWVNVLV